LHGLVRSHFGLSLRRTATAPDVVASPSGAVTLRSSENSAAASYTHETRAFNPASGVRYRITRLSKYRVGALTSGLTNQDPAATGSCSSVRTAAGQPWRCLERRVPVPGLEFGRLRPLQQHRVAQEQLAGLRAHLFARQTLGGDGAGDASRVPAREPRTVFDAGASRHTGPTLRPLAFR
jgi:hypothetical protein